LIGALQKDLGMPSLRLAYEPRAIRVRIARACVACPYSNPLLSAVCLYVIVSVPELVGKRFILRATAAIDYALIIRARFYLAITYLYHSAL
jgi:hypothetical protein